MIKYNVDSQGMMMILRARRSLQKNKGEVATATTSTAKVRAPFLLFPHFYITL